MRDPWIYDRISCDGAPSRERLKIPYEKATYIGGFVNGETASLTIVHHGGKVHFMVLPRFKMFADELWEKSSRLCPKRMFAIVPSLYGTLLNFAKKHGFKETGMQKQNFLKNGRLYDCHVLTRGE